MLDLKLLNKVNEVETQTVCENWRSLLYYNQ